MSKPKRREPLKRNLSAWERQPREGAAAFAAFVSYRSLPAAIRTVKAASGSSERQRYEWSATHRWRERAAAWDAHVDEEVQAEEIAAQRSMMRRHARLARKLLGHVEVALDGLDLSDLSRAQLHRMLDVGVKLERLTYGEATERVASDEDEAASALVEALLRDPNIRTQLDRVGASSGPQRVEGEPGGHGGAVGARQDTTGSDP